MRRTIIYLQNLVLRYYTYLYKDFVYLKASEVGMTLIEFDPQGDIFKHAAAMLTRSVAATTIITKLEISRDSTAATPGRCRQPNTC